MSWYIRAFKNYAKQSEGRFSRLKFLKEVEKDNYNEILTLRKRLEELEKENRFLKKAAAFFAKEID